MSAKGVLVAVLAAEVVFLVFGPHRPHAAPPAARARPPEAPWLSHDAAAQIVGEGGTLGPLFAGVTLGGPAPSPEVAAQIADFARANHVSIDLDVRDGDLVAVRFAVTYAGCCGYEGADVLALRLQRPSTGNCCVCGGPDTWIDDWTIATDDGVIARARVRVNRVEVRWQPMMTLPDLLERADGLVGRDAHAVGKAARADWTEVDHGREYVLQLPYPFRSAPPSVRDARDDLGVHVMVDAGTIVEVSFVLDLADDDAATDATALLRTRFGRPRTNQDTWTWTTSDRIVVAELDAGPARITIRSRSPHRA